jgi:hypothetical protein
MEYNTKYQNVSVTYSESLPQRMEHNTKYQNVWVPHTEPLPESKEQSITQNMKAFGYNTNDRIFHKVVHATYTQSARLI